MCATAHEMCPGVARLVLARQVCYIICIAPAESLCVCVLVWGRYKQTQTKHTQTQAVRTCHGGKMAAERQQRQGDGDIKSKNKERKNK